MTKNTQTTQSTERPPVIVVMGHIDHGKSTLLDYIRESNVTEGEAGGITQHISAYEVEKEKGGKTKRITFLDTPGHEAFTAMRSRGASVADIAILVVAADDGVKEQTLEALDAIKTADIPFIIAINKTDKPNADVQSTINSLIENEVYVEGHGGDISYTEISAKTGENIDELLDLILLAAELEEFTTNPSLPATGLVIETNVDPNRGTSATLIIQDGSIQQGQFIQAGKSVAPVRIMEDFTGTTIKEARASSPIRVTGFNSAPAIGSLFNTFDTKKEAEKAAQGYTHTKPEAPETEAAEERLVIPVIVKADVSGTAEAVAEKVASLSTDRAQAVVLEQGLGNITEGDVRRAGAAGGGVVVGFNVSIESAAKELAERTNVTLQTSNIIYDLVEWIEEEIQKRTPKIEVRESTGQAKVLKVFSQSKKAQIVGGKVVEGKLTTGAECAIIRRGEEVGSGVFRGLQKQREDTSEVQQGSEFGAEVESSLEIAPGDILEAFVRVEK